MADKITSPFITKTEDRYFCRECLHSGVADEVGDTVTCAMCDSPRVVLESIRIAELRAERIEANLAYDRECDPREDVINSSLVDVVEVFAEKNRFSEAESKSLLDRLVEAGEPNRFGLQWAVTRLAGDEQIVTDYDRASELERLGGQVIELPATEWRAIAGAGFKKAA